MNGTIRTMLLAAAAVTLAAGPAWADPEHGGHRAGKVSEARVQRGEEKAEKYFGSTDKALQELQASKDSGEVTPGDEGVVPLPVGASVDTGGRDAMDTMREQQQKAGALLNGGGNAAAGNAGSQGGVSDGRPMKWEGKHDNDGLPGRAFGDPGRRAEIRKELDALPPEQREQKIEEMHQQFQENHPNAEGGLPGRAFADPGRREEIKKELMELPPEERQQKMEEMKQEFQENRAERLESRREEFQKRWDNATPEDKAKFCAKAQERCAAQGEGSKFACTVAQNKCAGGGN